MSIREHVIESLSIIWHNIGIYKYNFIYNNNNYEMIYKKRHNSNENYNNTIGSLISWVNDISKYNIEYNYLYYEIY